MRRLQLSSARFALNHLLLLHHLLHHRCSDFNEKPKDGPKPGHKQNPARSFCAFFFNASVCLNPNPSKPDVLLRQLRAEVWTCAAPDPGCRAQPRVSPASTAGGPAEGAVQGPRRQLGTISLERHQNTDVSESEPDMGRFASLWSRHSLKFRACA